MATGNGRQALVTGASSGIGAATALELARQGCDVWLTFASDADGAEATAAACRKVGVAAAVSRLDLRDPTAVDALVADVRARWQGIHALVNNGGICPYTDADAISVEEWDAVLETNARGTFLLLRAALPLLRERTGDRSIVNLSSVAGEIGGVTTSVHYAASKAAILAITRTYARLLAPERIRVNAVAPGPIVTGITEQLGADRAASLAAGTPLGRFGTPDEVATVVALLAQPAGGFITGATYDVNGGLRVDG